MKKMIRNKHILKGIDALKCIGESAKVGIVHGAKAAGSVTIAGLRAIACGVLGFGEGFVESLKRSKNPQKVKDPMKTMVDIAFRNVPSNIVQRALEDTKEIDK